MEIKLDELESIISDQLEKYNNTKSSKFSKITIDHFMKEMKLLFTNRLSNDGHKFFGMGIPTTDECKLTTNDYYNIVILKKGTEGVKLEEIKRYLIQKNTYNLKQIKIILEKLTSLHVESYDNELEIFSNLVMDI